MAEYRTAFEAIFSEGLAVNVSIKDKGIMEGKQSFVLQIRQGDDVVWIPIEEAKGFVTKLNLWAIDNA